MALTRAQALAQIALLITDPLLKQNSALRVRQAFQIFSDNFLNVSEDGNVVASPKVNLTALVPPSVNNDSTEAYSGGSIWMHGNDIYIAKSVGVGAAVWVLSSTAAATAEFSTLQGAAIDNQSLVNYVASQIATLSINGQSLGSFVEGGAARPPASTNFGDFLFYTKTTPNPQELWRQSSNGVDWIDNLKFDTALSQVSYGSIAGTATEGNDPRVGTVPIDETNIGNNKVQVYDSITGNYKLEFKNHSNESSIGGINNVFLTWDEIDETSVYRVELVSTAGVQLPKIEIEHYGKEILFYAIDGSLSTDVFFNISSVFGGDSFLDLFDSGSSFQLKSPYGFLKIRASSFGWSKVAESTSKVIIPVTVLPQFLSPNALYRTTQGVDAGKIYWTDSSGIATEIGTGNVTFGTTAGTATEGNDPRVGTIERDETNIADGRIPSYNLSSNKIVFIDPPNGGGTANPLVQDLSTPNATDVISTQGVFDAIAGLGGVNTDDEKWLPNHAYAAKESFTISPTQSTATLLDGTPLTQGEVYNVYYPVATTSGASLLLSEISQLEMVEYYIPSSFKTRQFVNGTMLFDGNVVYEDIHVQAGAESFSLVNSASNINGSVHYLKYTSDGSAINTTADFNDFGKGIFAYMQTNPATYELKFEYIKTGAIEEIWVTGKRGEAAITGDPTGQIQGTFNEGDALPPANSNTGDYIFVSKINGEFWLQVSNGASWVDDKQVTDPTALQALTVANNTQSQLNQYIADSLPEIRPFDPVMNFNRDVTYSPTFVQTTAVALSLDGLGVNGVEHVVKFTSNGSPITKSVNFKELTTGMLAYMVANPATYEIMFMRVKTPVIDEVWMVAPSAAAGSAVSPQVATLSSISASSIPENNAINATIGTLSSDASPSATAYALGGVDAASFNVLNTGGVFTLRAGIAFDFETKTTYNITIAAVNSEGTQITPSSIVINITDVFEAGNTVPSGVEKIFVRPKGLSQNADMHIIWEAPTSDGGTPITGYQIERATVLGGAFSVLVADTGNTNLEYDDLAVGEGFYALYRVSAINSVGTGIAFGIASAITTSIYSGAAPTGAVDSFNTYSIGATPASFDDLNGNSLTELLSAGINSYTFNSKTGGSYGSNLWGIAQAKFNFVADTYTDYSVIFHLTYKSQASKAGVIIRSVTTGSASDGYLIQLDQVNNEIKVFSIFGAGQFDQIVAVTTTTALSLNTRHLVRISIVGQELSISINDMTTTVLTHTFVQNLHTAGGVVLSAGWDATDENNVLFDNLMVMKLDNIVAGFDIYALPNFNLGWKAVDSIVVNKSGWNGVDEYAEGVVENYNVGNPSPNIRKNLSATLQSDEPLYVVSAINGLPALRFNDQLMRTETLTPTPRPSVTRIVVAKILAIHPSTSTMILATASSASPMHLAVHSSGKLGAYAGATGIWNKTTGASLVVGAPVILTNISQGANSKTFINELIDLVGDDGGSGKSVSAFAWGKAAGTNTGANVEIAEEVNYSVDLELQNVSGGTNDLQRVIAELKLKYGIS